MPLNDLLAALESPSPTAANAALDKNGGDSPNGGAPSSSSDELFGGLSAEIDLDAYDEALKAMMMTHDDPNGSAAAAAASTSHTTTTTSSAAGASSSRTDAGTPSSTSVTLLLRGALHDGTGTALSYRMSDDGPTLVPLCTALSPRRTTSATTLISPRLSAVRNALNGRSTTTVSPRVLRSSYALAKAPARSSAPPSESAVWGDGDGDDEEEDDATARLT